MEEGEEGTSNLALVRITIGFAYILSQHSIYISLAFSR